MSCHTESYKSLTLLTLLQITGVEKVMQARCKRVFGNAHTYHVNAISISSDQETFISSHDLRVNLWHLDHTNQSFNVVDIKPPNMEDLTEASQHSLLYSQGLFEPL